MFESKAWKGDTQWAFSSDGLQEKWGRLQICHRVCVEVGKHMSPQRFRPCAQVWGLQGPEALVVVVVVVVVIVEVVCVVVIGIVVVVIFCDSSSSSSSSRRRRSNYYKNAISSNSEML